MLEGINEKEFFTIGEVKRICGVPEYSIRYWEAEFGLIKPVRKQSGHRRYTKADIETVLKIKDLIYHKRLTLEGAKKMLRSSPRAAGENAASAAKNPKLLTEIYEIIQNIIKE